MRAKGGLLGKVVGKKRGPRLEHCLRRLTEGYIEEKRVSKSPGSIPKMVEGY